MHTSGQEPVESTSSQRRRQTPTPREPAWMIDNEIKMDDTPRRPDSRGASPKPWTLSAKCLSFTVDKRCFSSCNHGTAWQGTKVASNTSDKSNEFHQQHQWISYSQVGGSTVWSGIETQLQICYLTFHILAAQQGTKMHLDLTPKRNVVASGALSN